MPSFTRYKKGILVWCFFFITSLAVAKTIQVDVYAISKTSPQKFLGTVEFVDGKYGLEIFPHLNSLSPGSHGFHLHEFASCENEGMAAGGHFDPAQTQNHHGPFKDSGHLGDLPVLYVESSGHADQPMLAPRLRITDLKEHSLIIHEGGDTYANEPPLGGGGARIACAVLNF